MRNSGMSFYGNGLSQSVKIIRVCFSSISASYNTRLSIGVRRFFLRIRQHAVETQLMPEHIATDVQQTRGLNLVFLAEFKGGPNNRFFQYLKQLGRRLLAKTLQRAFQRRG